MTTEEREREKQTSEVPVSFPAVRMGTRDGGFVETLGPVPGPHGLTAAYARAINNGAFPDEVSWQVVGYGPIPGAKPIARVGKDAKGRTVAQESVPTIEHYVLIYRVAAERVQPGEQPPERSPGPEAVQ